MRHLVRIIMQLLLDGALASIFLAAALATRMVDIEEFSFSVIVLAMATRVVSMEMPIRAVMSWKRRQLDWPIKTAEYALTGIAAWIVCQSVYWSYLTHGVTLVPIHGTYPILIHAAVIVGAFALPLLIRKSRDTRVELDSC